MIQDTSSIDRPIEQPRGWRTRGRWIAVAAVVLAGAALALLPATRRWARAERAFDEARIRVATVARGDLERDVLATGRVVAALHPTLFSPAKGIVGVNVKAGTAVRRGAVLAQVVSPDLTSRVTQERSALLSLQSELGRQETAARQAQLRNREAIAVLEVRLAAAERILARAQTSSAEGIISKIDLEKAQDEVQIIGLQLKNARENAALERETGDFAVNNARQQVERQQAVVADAQRQLDELSIRAPFDGVVSNVAVQDRDAVVQGQALLTIVDLSGFEIDVDVPENYAADIAPGMPAEVRDENRTWPARLVSFSPEVKDNQIRGTVAFDGETPPGLRQNQRVSVRLLLDRRAGVLKIARGPFVESGGGRIAYVVENGMAVRRPIRLGAIAVGEVEIASGLREGEKVIVSDTSEFEGAGTVLLR